MWAAREHSFYNAEARDRAQGTCSETRIHTTGFTPIAHQRMSLLGSSVAPLVRVRMSLDSSTTARIESCTSRRSQRARDGRDARAIALGGERPSASPGG